MQYFIYKITSGSTGVTKDLEFLEKFDGFKQAKKKFESCVQQKN